MSFGRHEKGRKWISSHRQKNLYKLLLLHGTLPQPGMDAWRLYQQVEKMVLKELIEKFNIKDRTALAKIVSIVEKREKDYLEILKSIKELTQPYIIGVTGAPGAGKSSVINRLISAFRKREKKVGVIAFDPYSPFTGGAILGDRIRMTEHTLDDGVYIRSISAGASGGGISPVVFDIIRIFKGFGFSVIIIETIGTGQSEIAIRDVADTVLLILTPESGDVMQAMKAGILEIPDLVAINKSEISGSAELFNELNFLYDKPRNGWKVRVIKISALRNEGIDELVSAIEEHKEYLKKSGLIKESNERRKKTEFFSALQEDFIRRLKKGEKEIFNMIKGGDIYEMVENFWKDEKIIKRIFEDK